MVKWVIKPFLFMAFFYLTLRLKVCIKTSSFQAPFDYFLAQTGALEEAISYVHACVRVCVCVTFLKRTLQMSF